MTRLVPKETALKSKIFNKNNLLLIRVESYTPPLVLEETQARTVVLLNP